MNKRLQIAESSASRQHAVCSKQAVFPTLFSVFCMLFTGLHAQNYRCDWSVVGQGGGDMTSTSFRAGATIGQTAIGQIAGTTYQAFIGFWQIDTAGTGIQEEQNKQQNEPLTTCLLPPAPNPCFGTAQIRYSLAAEARVSLELFDMAGRCVRTLVRAMQKPGRYSSSILHPSSLSRGIYFCRFRADDYEQVRKLILIW